MAVPTASEVRTFLEGYGINESILTDTWLTARITNMVVPYINRAMGFEALSDSAQTITEYVSGTGHDTLILSHKNVASITSIQYLYGGYITSYIDPSSVVIVPGGILKLTLSISEGIPTRYFAKGNKNIKVVYTLDVSDSDLKEAAIYITAEQALGFVQARTGGGSISVQGFSRNFGNRGKYTDIRNDLWRMAVATMKKYMSSVVNK